MQVNFDENYDLAVYFDDYDLCSKCKNRKKCPLVQALSQELVINIFEPNTPLHDGAIIVRGEIIKSAACILPLTKRTDLKSEFGTRHRAGIGISELTDCISVIVSEETGKISLAMNGKISTNLDSEQLNKFLRRELLKEI